VLLCYEALYSKECDGENAPHEDDRGNDQQASLLGCASDREVSIMRFAVVHKYHTLDFLRFARSALIDCWTISLHGLHTVRPWNISTGRFFVHLTHRRSPCFFVRRYGLNGIRNEMHATAFPTSDPAGDSFVPFAFECGSTLGAPLRFGCVYDIVIH
jgi:hypothetical protein